MNAVFSAIIVASVAYMLYTSPAGVLPAMLEGATRSVYFALTLFAVYTVWLTVLKILERVRLDEKIAKVLKAPSRFLFPNESDEAYGALSVNLSANLLGMGGAATPAGIKSMETMKSRKNRIMLVVVNSTSIQLIPTTIIGIRAAAGATTDIILPSLIATFATTFIGILLVKIFVRDK